MKRRWGFTGAASGQPFEIAQDARTQVRLELHRFDITNVPDEFFEDLGAAVGLFRSIRDMAESRRPAKVRDNLKAAIEAAHTLNEKLNGLDGNSRYLIRVGGCAVDLQDDHLWPIIQALGQAAILADEYPQSGRLPEDERLYLAVDVKNAIATHLGVEATSTKEGVFESILTVVLQIATGQQVNSVHELSRRALKAMKVEVQKGLFEYRLSKDD